MASTTMGFRLEGMEKNMETTIMGYIRIAIGIQYLLPSSPKASQAQFQPQYDWVIVRTFFKYTKAKRYNVHVETAVRFSYPAPEVPHPKP